MPMFRALSPELPELLELPEPCANASSAGERGEVRLVGSAAALGTERSRGKLRFSGPRGEVGPGMVSGDAGRWGSGRHAP